MLRSLKSLKGYGIAAKDGEIGKIHDFLFDDEFWSIRYLVIDIRNWLVGRKVMLSPHILGQPSWKESIVPVELTREEVRSSPDIETDQPVSRQREIELHQHYGWPYYWVTGGAWPVPATPVHPESFRGKPGVMTEEPVNGDKHLQSMLDVIGYHIHASDGSIGHLEDIIADTETWDIRYLVVDTHNWVPGKQVLIAPQWLVGPIVWEERMIEVTMSREEIRESPEFDPATPVNQRYETRLYDYYGRPGYWKIPEKSHA